MMEISAIVKEFKLFLPQPSNKTQLSWKQTIKREFENLNVYSLEWNTHELWKKV